MSDAILDTTDDSFDTEVLNSEAPVLVDFWAPWCGPCRALTPTIEKFAAEAGAKVKVVKHNTQDHEGTAAKFGVAAIPTLLVFSQGKEVHRLVGGGRTVDELKKVFQDHAGVSF